MFFSLEKLIEGSCCKQEIDAPASAKVHAHAKTVKHNSFPKTEASPITLDLEEDEINNDDENDIPYFSDIETMVSIYYFLE